MANGIGVQLKWYGERVKRAVRDHFSARISTVGEFLSSEAKLRAPVDTGNLRNSIDFHVDTQDLKLYYGTPVYYGVYQELGFVTSAGRFIQNAYLLPALLENRRRIVELLR